MAPFIGQNIGEDPKKRFSQQNEVGFSLRKYVKVFGLKRKKKQKMVSPQSGDTWDGPPPLATPLSITIIVTDHKI